MSVLGPAEIVARIEDLPILPGVVVRMLKVDTGAENYFEEVVSLATEDPLFAVEVLRAANSWGSAPRNPIVSIPEAAARLGTKWILDKVASLGVRRVFVPVNAEQRRLWSHSIDVAILTGELSDANGFDPELGYVAGLLHDLGRFVMFEETPEQLGEVERAGWTTPARLVEAEKFVCGYDHIDLGVLTAERLGLPDPLPQIIRFHHTPPPELTALEPDERKLIAALQAADFIAVGTAGLPADTPIPTIKAKIDEVLRPFSWASNVVDSTALSHRMPEIWAEADAAVDNLGLRTDRAATAA